MSMEWEDAREFCQFIGRGEGGVQGGGRIIIQSVLGQSRLNTFSQRAKHKVMGNTGNLMETEVAFVERFENPTNEWCFVWLQRWKGATPAPSRADSKTAQKKKRRIQRRWMFSQKELFWPLCSYEAEGSIQWWWVDFNGIEEEKIYSAHLEFTPRFFGRCSRIYFANPIWSCFSFVNNFTFNYSPRHITTLYVASRLVSTLFTPSCGSRKCSALFERSALCTKESQNGTIFFLRPTMFKWVLIVQS